MKRTSLLAGLYGKDKKSRGIIVFYHTFYIAWSIGAAYSKCAAFVPGMVCTKSQLVQKHIAGITGNYRFQLRRVTAHVVYVPYALELLQRLGKLMGREAYGPGKKGTILYVYVKSMSISKVSGNFARKGFTIGKYCRDNFHRCSILWPMEPDLHVALALAYAKGIGPVTGKQLFDYFASAHALLNAPRDTLIKLLGQQKGAYLHTFLHEFNVEAVLSGLKKKEITVLSMANPSYPQHVKLLPDPPLVLFVKGKEQSLPLLNASLFAVVGTRSPSTYGTYITKEFVAHLVRNGLHIVSGLALGVDTLAHTTCLKEGGKTIAVLGCGVDIVYPPQNQPLYHQIEQDGGLIISEFPPGTITKPGMFVARNRIVAALSLGVLVVEGKQNSGSLITARNALEYGREVFAVPANITSPNAFAPNLLIKEGAHVCLEPKDITETLGIKATTFSQEVYSNLTPEENKIIQILRQDEADSEYIAVKTERKIEDLLMALSLLEMKGIIQKNIRGKYELV